MNIDFEKRYAYCEIYDILNWLGIDYIRKIPKEIYKMIKEERKFGYDCQLDFSKPLKNQIRQLTKNYIAFFRYNFWLDDPKEKIRLKQELEKNEEMNLIRKSNERKKEIFNKMNNSATNVSSNINANNC